MSLKFFEYVVLVISGIPDFLYFLSWKTKCIVLLTGTISLLAWVWLLLTWILLLKIQIADLNKKEKFVPKEKFSKEKWDLYGCILESHFDVQECAKKEKMSRIEREKKEEIYEEYLDNLPLRERFN